MSYHLIDKINKKELKEGINFINETKSLIIYKNKEEYKCYLNQCKHQGGKFLKDIEDIVKCCRHGWKFNCKTSCYTHTDTIKQDLLHHILNDDYLSIYEENHIKPWDIDIKERELLEQNEFKVTFFSHASIEIKCGNDIIFTDPWFEGPAFGRGWWNLFQIPEDAYLRLSQANYIYISHFHSDHLSYYTLKKLYELNPDITFIMGKLEQPIMRGGICGNIEDLKFKNIILLDLGTWFTISKNTRLMILPDGIYDDLDTCLLVEYKGHKIMDFVDCCMPNNRILPKNIDLILSDFAGGSSGYPSIYHEMLGEEQTLKIAKKNAKLFLNKIVDCLKLVNCKCWIPFAGYFIEAHPDDNIIKKLNYHNNPQDACNYIEKNIKNIKTWVPFPSGSIDLFDFNTSELKGEIDQYYIDYKQYDFSQFTDYYKKYIINSNINFNNDFITKYFQWANFKNYDLILHIIETSDDFKEYKKEYYIDFMNLTFPKSKPKNRNYFRIKARQDIMRYLMITGNSWELLQIGFSGRYYHEPKDLYPIDFKQHFEWKLPHVKL